MARIAVIGPGAIGATVAAWLSQDPAHDVAVCVRTPVEQLVIDTPQGPITARPTVLTEPGQSFAAEWVLVATKAYDTRAAAAWFEGLAGARTVVAVLQNGIEHRERFEGLSHGSKILPAIVDIPAERSAPGHVVQRRLGWIRVPDEPAGREFASLFSQLPIDVAADADFAETAWRKLALNCGGAVNALVMQPAGIVQDDGVATAVRGLVNECLAVARAEGVNLPDDLADEVVANYRAAPPDSVNSIHADRLAGRPMEVDARNGVIVRLGQKHEIFTPLNEMVTALLAVVPSRRQSKDLT